MREEAGFEEGMGFIEADVFGEGDGLGRESLGREVGVGERMGLEGWGGDGFCGVRQIGGGRRIGV